MALREDDEYRKLFDAAIEAREDGEREDAAAQLKAMLALYPGDTAVSIEYARILIGLKNFGAADAHLHHALERDPGNHVIREVWATLPFQGCNWSEQIHRDRIFRAGLPDAQKHLGKQSLIYSLAAYWESGQWAAAADYIRANRDAFLADPDTFGMAVQILGLLGENDDVRAMVEEAPPAAWSRLPAEAAANLRRRVRETARNQALLQSSGVRLISLGQHCLPYQMGVRWGLIPGPVDAAHMTPFDLGAFAGDTAASAIAADFAGFADRAGFVEAPAWGGTPMFRHAGAGVHFHHERGPYWMEAGGAKFFARWERMLANWRDYQKAARRLYVFCLVGEGDLEKLVAAAEAHLLGRNARLLVVNVLKEHRHCPQSKRVAYLHAPYPDDYFWVELPNHASDRGFAFETGIVNGILAQIAELAAEPVLSDADYAEYRRLLDGAVDAREDGEPEDSAEQLITLLAKFPADAEASVEYAKTCRSLGKADDAEPALARAIAANPAHFQLRKAWVDLPSASQNWEESIIRARTLREAFPPPHYPEAWRTLEIEYDFLYDTGQWEALSRLVDENWKNYLAYRYAVPGGIAALNNLFDTRRLTTLIETATPEAWRHLPDEALENLRLRAEIAAQNAARVAASGVRVISLGQNCLPYLVGGRWGLLGPAREAELQPFDIGGFHGDNAAEVIASDFAAFRDRGKFIVTPAFGGGQMYTHQPSNVGFFHERGPWWMNDPAKFFARIDMMLANWQRVKAAAKRLFVFCYCGAGDLDRLVEAMDRELLGPNSHLLIIDVLQEPHVPPAHERVSYVHVAYPPDYTWTKVADQVSARGTAFELGIVTPIAELLSQFEPAHEIARAGAARNRAIRDAAQKARAAGQLENAAGLLAPLLAQEPEDAAAALDHAHLLRELNRADEADAVLARAVAHNPADFHLHKTWAETPIHAADWNEAIDRGAALRARFAAHPHAFYSLNAELNAYYDAGRWEEAVGFLHQNWIAFTSRGELFGNAVDMLGKLFRHHGVRDLLDAATPEAMQGFDAQALASLTHITDAAADNQKRLRASGARVISLGHNAYPYILAGRWGLNSGPAKFEALTPFDIGGFSNRAAYEAIGSDFAAFHNHGDFVEAPAWFGGQMLIHQPTDINFLSHRRARWRDADRAHFFAHWEIMLANWRRMKGGGRRVFLMVLSDQPDLAALARFFDTQLPGDSHLVAINQHHAALPDAVNGPRITYIHAPAPDHYHWPRLTGAAHPINIAYEEKIIRAVTAKLG